MGLEIIFFYIIEYGRIYNKIHYRYNRGPIYLIMFGAQQDVPSLRLEDFVRPGDWGTLDTVALSVDICAREAIPGNVKMFCATNQQTS